MYANLWYAFIIPKNKKSWLPQNFRLRNKTDFYSSLTSIFFILENWTKLHNCCWLLCQFLLTFYFTGGMTLRRPNKSLVPVHILLLEEAVVILHREGDRFLLKFFQSGSTAQPSPLSPIIKMNTLLVRTNAVCKYYTIYIHNYKDSLDKL